MGTLEIVCNQRYFDAEVRNVLYYQGSAVTIANGQALANSLRAVWSAGLFGHLVPQWSLYSFTMRDLEVAQSPGVDFIPGAGTLVGTATGAPLPPQVAMFARFRTGTTPPNKKSMFLAGFSTQALNNGRVGASARNSAASAMATLMNLGAQTSGESDLMSLRKAPDGTVLLANKVTSVIVSDVWRTQRSRTFGEGI